MSSVHVRRNPISNRDHSGLSPFTPVSGLPVRLLIPPLMPDHIARPRLTSLLDAAVRRLVTLVVAPAGFGKSTLLADWCSDRDPQVAWLTLSPGEADAGALVHSISQALRKSGFPLAGEAESLLHQGGETTPEQLATALADDVAGLSAPGHLILDDLHRA